MNPSRQSAIGFAAIVFASALFFEILEGTPIKARPGQAQDTSPEILTHDSQPEFAMHAQRTEVLVRVVVRDAKGQAVANLQQTDFQILDNGEPETITHFSIENPGAPTESKAPAAPAGIPAELSGESAPPIVFPHRFTALYFDDVHIAFEDIVRTREAAWHYLDSEMKPGDRVGLFTSSGQNQVDFTDDRARLHDALMALQPRPLASPSTAECPEIFPFQAYKIAEAHDPLAVQVATQDAVYECCGGPGNPCLQADQDYIETEASRLVQENATQTRTALRGLEGLCRRMGALSGQRRIVMVSPGFLVLTESPFLDQVVDQALRLNVVINTLDARGLYTNIIGGDASEGGSVRAEDANLMARKAQYRSDSKSMSGDVLASLASDTGGVAFRNNNDFATGFERTGGFAQISYLLAFSPQELKPDGRIHILKVSLASNPAGYTVQARKSYGAPTKNLDAAALAADRLEQLVFSPENSQTIPIHVHTQFFKTASGDARLSIMAGVDISKVQFQEAQGRNLNKLTVVTVLFDSYGNYVDGQKKMVDLNLKDATLAKLREAGMNLRINFTVKPGTYLVREVVQDDRDSQLSAQSLQVVIP